MSSVAHVSGQRRAVVPSSISTLAGENGRSLHTEAGRRTSCVDSPPLIAKLKSTMVDEKDQAETRADGNAVRKRRQSAIGKRVVVGMSGGVDSSVAAMLLQRQASHRASSHSRWECHQAWLSFRGLRVRYKNSSIMDLLAASADEFLTSLSIPVSPLFNHS